MNIMTTNRVIPTGTTRTATTMVTSMDNRTSTSQTPVISMAVHMAMTTDTITITVIPTVTITRRVFTIRRTRPSSTSAACRICAVT